MRCSEKVIPLNPIPDSDRDPVLEAIIRFRDEIDLPADFLMAICAGLDSRSAEIVLENCRNLPADAIVSIKEADWAS